MNERGYRWLWRVALPFAFARLLWRSRNEPSYRLHWRERLGWYDDGVPPKPLVWLHAVSVGETRAISPLVHALATAHPNASFLLTHMTPGGRQAARQAYADLIADGRLISVYLPYDLPFAMRRFLRRFEPTFGLLMETEIWPTLLAECESARVPVALVNARLSMRSARRGTRFNALFSAAARRLACVVAQTEADAERLRAFEAPNVVVAGNLKFDVAIDSALLERGREWRRAAGDARPVVLLASTREAQGES
ncbi:MAG TPA: glycosyltransferase N-terminal domain-containing protein, partial [Burkholderiaceae bacterium]|nr:glycosyltransferase N-terminal domain-containing protein [Burkholderiaceae bacterium]